MKNIYCPKRGRKGKRSENFAFSLFKEKLKLNAKLFPRGIFKEDILLIINNIDILVEVENKDMKNWSTCFQNFPSNDYINFSSRRKIRKNCYQMVFNNSHTKFLIYSHDVIEGCEEKTEINSKTGEIYKVRKIPLSLSKEFSVWSFDLEDFYSIINSTEKDKIMQNFLDNQKVQKAIGIHQSEQNVNLISLDEFSSGILNKLNNGKIGDSDDENQPYLELSEKQKDWLVAYVALRYVFTKKDIKKKDEKKGLLLLTLEKVYSKFGNNEKTKQELIESFKENINLDRPGVESLHETLKDVFGKDIGHFYNDLQKVYGIKSKVVNEKLPYRMLLTDNIIKDLCESFVSDRDCAKQKKEDNFKKNLHLKINSLSDDKLIIVNSIIDSWKNC